MSVTVISFRPFRELRVNFHRRPGFWLVFVVEKRSTPLKNGMLFPDSMTESVSMRTELPISEPLFVSR